MNRLNLKLKQQIDAYIDILTPVIDLNLLDRTIEEKYKLKSIESNTIKNDYYKMMELILNDAKNICQEFKGERALVIALFTMRAVCKQKMYEGNMGLSEEWTCNFKICNGMFFHLLSNKKVSQEYIDIKEAETQIRKYFTLIYCYIENIIIYNKVICDSDDESYEEYYNKLIEVSNKKEDMNTYEISSTDLKKDLQDRKLTINHITQSIIRDTRKDYYRKSIEKSDKKLYEMIQKDNLNNPFDDIIIIKKSDFIFYEKRFKNFIIKFSVKGNENLQDNENELCFSYIDDEYVFISKIMMNTTQEIVNKALEMQQYTKLIKYYFGFNENTSNKNNYNKLMTYKIADLLYKNNYLLPIEKKKYRKSELLFIPSIEISNYPGYKNEYGDIDIIFISPFTNKLYNLEYKNYQMLVTKSNDLSNEIDKVKKEKVTEKVLRREKIMKNNLAETIKKLFESFSEEITEVKSIILTTKPNYYFYKNKKDGYEYFEWIEFKEKIENHIL